MLDDSPAIQQFLPFIHTLPAGPLTKEKLLVPDLLVQKKENVEIYYAPHNEFINPHASILIAGITPGWTQMKSAFEKARDCLADATSLDDLALEVKRAGRFAGGMRKNLVDMLNECGLNDKLGLDSCSAIFGTHDFLLHTTSIIKYPVFIQGRNYNGHTPSIERVPELRSFAYQSFPEELSKLRDRFLIIPLGKTVSTVLQSLMSEGRITEHPCLFGFPHPSGANGHRHRQFKDRKEEFKKKINEFFNS
ncbi:hypothetical protein [Peribacillus kribbensis]|uniref:hypothetical protein n=1 Tax=Peribacillus kribbensis TaxID=356658 RepID=UPI00040DFF30|nr:hypothetical protein [Peribacillus kribbensis]